MEQQQAGHAIKERSKLGIEPPTLRLGAQLHQAALRLALTIQYTHSLAIHSTLVPSSQAGKIQQHTPQSSRDTVLHQLVHHTLPCLGAAWSCNKAN